MQTYGVHAYGVHVGCTGMHTGMGVQGATECRVHMGCMQGARRVHEGCKQVSREHKRLVIKCIMQNRRHKNMRLSLFVALVKRVYSIYKLIEFSQSLNMIYRVRHSVCT